MPVSEWRSPALVWNGNVSSVGRPRILEIRNDEFIPVFLRAMAKADPGSFFEEHQLSEGATAAQPLKLYQPLHGCYYLVTASLVCRQLGLPDKAIARSDGETVSFVIRRIQENSEQAWVVDDDGGHWKDLSSNEVLALAEDEEQFPMHPVTVCPRPETPQSAFTDFIERDIHYGYIPTGNRDKYRDTVAREGASDTPPEQIVQDYFDEVEQQATDDGSDFNFRVGLFRQRVYEPWRQLIRRLTGSASRVASSGSNGVMPATDSQLQLYTLLEFGDFLKNNVPTLWAALEANSDASLSGDMATLFETLTDELTVEEDDAGEMSLRDALVALEPDFPLVRGKGDEPSESYDLGDTLSESELESILLTQVENAIREEDEPIRPPEDEGEDSELARLIGQQVQPEPATEATYHIRAVYVYDPDPDCTPVVSEQPSPPFTLAPFFEPDAPARMVRLEAPSIKLKDLRRYSRGVGISMSPELHKLSNCMRGDDQDGVIDSLTDSCEGSGLSVQWVCTFSIQIVFLVAFIVMFIFLIALNFIFWWLAFLRICLPIPKRG